MDFVTGSEGEPVLVKDAVRASGVRVRLSVPLASSVGVEVRDATVTVPVGMAVATAVALPPVRDAE